MQTNFRKIGRQKLHRMKHYNKEKMHRCWTCDRIYRDNVSRGIICPDCKKTKSALKTRLI